MCLTIECHNPANLRFKQPSQLQGFPDSIYTPGNEDDTEDFAVFDLCINNFDYRKMFGSFWLSTNVSCIQ